MVEYKSKTVLVPRSSYDLFNAFTDIRGMLGSIPEDKKENVVATEDGVRFVVSGFEIGIRLSEKLPFSKVVYSDDGAAPFHFNVIFNFGQTPDVLKTELQIAVEADLNFMMKALLGGKIQEYLDKAVTSIATGAPIV